MNNIPQEHKSRVTVNAEELARRGAARHNLRQMGVSLADIAFKLGIQYTTVTGYFAGRSKAVRGESLKLAVALGLAPNLADERKAFLANLDKVGKSVDDMSRFNRRSVKVSQASQSVGAGAV